MAANSYQNPPNQSNKFEHFQYNSDHVYAKILRGKTALITGASSGIGLACAESLDALGVKTILWARRQERLNEIKSRLKLASIFKVDVCDRENVKHATESLLADQPVPDILIQAAGLAVGVSKIYEGDFEDWDRMLDTNVKGLLNVTRFIMPAMVKENRGHIINIGSVAGHSVYPGGNVYNASKYAERALSEAMNIDAMGTKIRVCSVDPGATETEFSEVRFQGDKERAKKVYLGYQAMQAQDIADSILHVLSAPAHVNILNVVMRPTAQRNSYMVHRES